MIQSTHNCSFRIKKSQFSQLSSIQYGMFLFMLIASLILGESMFVVGHTQTLGELPGQSSLQSTTGVAIENLWPNIRDLSGRTGLEQDLFLICRSLVHSENELSSSGLTTNSLGISSGELSRALQQVAGEEVLAPRTMASKTFNGQQRNLRGRLTALRGGARGFSVAGLNLNGIAPLPDLRAQSMELPGLQPRGGGASGDLGNGTFSRLGTFISGSLGTGEKDETSREDGFDFNTAGVTVGVDYRFLEELVVGTAFSYSHFDGDFHKSSVNAGGGSDSDGYVFSIYGTYYLQDFYLEGIGSVGWNDHDSKRKIVIPSNTAEPSTRRTAKGETDSTQYSLSLGTGYAAHVGSVDFGPFARLTYFKLDIDGFEESGAGGLNLEVEGQDITSLISALGLQASKKFSWKWGVWYPQIRGEWDHEFKNDAKTTTTKYVNDPFNNPLFIRNEAPDRNFFRVGATLANVSAGGTQVYLDYETFLGLRNISNHIVTLGARMEF